MLISNRAGGTYQSLSEEEMKQFDGLGEDFDEPEVERESWKENGCRNFKLQKILKMHEKCRKM